MIDPITEELIDAKQTTRLQPFRRNGKPCHVAAVYRYWTRGCRAVNGEMIKLEHVRTPGGLKTSREAVTRWLHALTTGDEAETPDVTKENERAEAELAAAGF